jgi:hypothetical protein
MCWIARGMQIELPYSWSLSGRAVVFGEFEF